MKKEKIIRINERIKTLSNEEILERYKYLIHTRGERQALEMPIGLDLDEEILTYEETLRNILNLKTNYLNLKTN